MRVMIVGTYSTGDGRYGPVPSFFGMHAGTQATSLIGEARHGASRKLSHPQPGPLGCSGVASGLLPVNPSSCPATSSMCEPHVGTASVSKVWSAIVNLR